MISFQALAVGGVLILIYVAVSLGLALVLGRMMR